MEQTVFITGGGSGIGEALAYQFARSDWQVFISGRNRNKLEKVQAEYPQHIQIIQNDLEDLQSIEQLTAAIDAKHLNCLVHNAAIIDPMESIRTVDPIEFERTMRINVTAPLLLTQQLLPRLNQSRVLFISSGAAESPLYEWSAYCASKAALRMLKNAFQSEVEEVSFADMKPGIVSTGMIDHVLASEFKGVDSIRQIDSQGKLLDAKVVGQFLFWLLTECSKSDYENKYWDIYETWHHSSWLKDGHCPSLK